MNVPPAVPESHIDHLVVTAPSLESGAAYVRDVLGVAMQAGGQHPRMGTHNQLLKLGQRLFLEVIAIDPHAASPARQRWFGLDDARAGAAPRLATWVVRTNDIEAAAKASPVLPGLIEPMNRGGLNWFISIPQDGGMPMNGVAPTLIQWQAAAHPADGLVDVGCSLDRLEGYHPEAKRVDDMLKAIGLAGGPVSLAEGSVPQLIAHIRTPNGVARLGN